MSAAEKLRLRKAIEQKHGWCRNLTRQDLFSGRWFSRFVDQNSPAAFAAAPIPPDVKAKHPGAETEDDLADAVVTAAIHEAIAATDAYEENLTGTEIRNLTDRKAPKSEEHLSGDSVALLAELCYTILIDINLVLALAAAHGRQPNAETLDVYEIFGRALGAFDFEAAKAEGDLPDKVGAKIYDRAIAQSLATPLADAQRKGFYCFYAKAISKEARKVMGSLAAWEAPKAQTGPMSSADEAVAFET
jgi:hypothetical protein